MAKNYHHITADVSEYVRELKPMIQPVLKGFYDMAGAATQAGALDTKTKEYIALAIGVSTRCDGCIGFHAKALHELGATRQDVAEVLGMAVYMGGGPSLMYAADALRAFDQFAAAQKPSA